MNGPQSMNDVGVLPAGMTWLDLCEVQPSPPKDLQETGDMLRRVTPELEKRRTQDNAADEKLQMLGSAQHELNAESAKVEAELQPLRIKSWAEAIQNYGSCDMRALSEQLRPLEYQLTFITDAKDLLVHKLIPAALLHKLESAFSLRKFEALEANLLAAISHARTMEKAAGVFEEEGRIAIIGERTQALRKCALEAERRVVQAEEELRELRKRQLTVEQQRYACHQVTRAEAVAAIPACAAIIA